MFKFELTETLTNVVLEALAEMPLSKSFDAFVAIRSQLAIQRQAMASQLQPQAIQTVPAVAPVTNGAAQE